MKPFHAFLAGILAFSAASAWAQWQWLDKDGRKVFSDRAPSSDIPEKNILKRPNGMRATPVVAPPTDGITSPATASPASAPKDLGADKELEAKKKQAAEAEASKRKAEDERINKAKVENCARARQAKISFDSGIRIATTNAKGEREIMDDAARALEGRRIQGIIDTDCR
jgi:hypothetical protein